TPIIAELARRLDVSIEELAGRDPTGSIPSATILLAEMSARLGEPDAGSRLDELEAEARRSGDRHALSRALQARGLVALERRIADPTARARLQWTLARTYAEQGRLRLAERYGREVLSHLEESEQSALRGRAHLLLGQILLDQRRRTEADEELTRAEELMRDAG